MSGRLVKPLLILSLQRLIKVLVDVEDTGGVEVTGESHGVLHLIQSVGGDHSQGVLLGVYGTLLQSGEQLRERHRCRAGSPRLEGRHVDGILLRADGQTLQCRRRGGFNVVGSNVAVAGFCPAHGVQPQVV